MLCANSSFHSSITYSGGSSSDHALQTAPSTPLSLLLEAHLQTMLCKQLLPLLRHFFWRLIFRPCFATLLHFALQTAPSTPPSLLLEAHLQIHALQTAPSTPPSLLLKAHTSSEGSLRPCFANSSFHSSVTSSGGSSSDHALQTAPSHLLPLLLLPRLLQEVHLPPIHYTSSEGSSSDHALQTAPSSLLLEAHLHTLLCKQLLPLLRHFF